MGEHGAGTLVKVVNAQGKTRWRTAVTMPDGRRVWRTARTAREAERKRQELVAIRELELDPTRRTLADYLDGWIGGLASAVNPRIRPKTLDWYRTIVAVHIAPKPIGKVKLSALTPGKVQAWIDADESAPRTVRHHHAVLRRALNVAVRQRILPYNPAQFVELPDAVGDVAKPLTAEEARKLVDATRDDRLGALWRLAIATGLRESELLGLSWDDVEPDAVTVRQQLQRRVRDAERAAAKAEGRKPVGEWSFVDPKAARKVVRVSIDAGTAAALERHRVKMAGERTPAWRFFGLVFTDAGGDPLHGADVRDSFLEACKAAGIGTRRFHDLRHTSAHLLQDAGVEEAVRMSRLGHNTTAMARKYSGASEARDRQAADELGRALG